MKSKRSFQFMVAIAILATSFATTGRALAWGCSTYITVQWGDTLSGLAVTCGTTVDAIRAANPGLGWWAYAGQVLYMPSGSHASVLAYSSPAYTPSSPRTFVVQLGHT